MTVKDFPNKTFDSLKQLHRALSENKSELIAIRKSTIKIADAVGFAISGPDIVGNVVKSSVESNSNPTEIQVKAVINTTKLFDSHYDVHADGIWKRSLDHNATKLHLQEHKRSFATVINDKAQASVEEFKWSDLGAAYEGKTQGLVFDSLVKKSRNSEMFEQYKNGWVTNHSVGMQYVDLCLCINSEEKWAIEEKENWEQWYETVANKEDLEGIDFFWLIKEAKVLEGSAVLMGSNWITPTLENKTQPAPAPAIDPSKDTQKQLESIKLKF